MRIFSKLSGSETKAVSGFHASTLFARICLLFLAVFAVFRPALASEPYDPLVLPPVALQKILAPMLDCSVADSSRDRVIPIRVYLPPGNGPAPVVLFSHGLGGARTNDFYLGEHWSARGYVVVFLQHHGSDDAIWRGLPPDQRIQALRRAASSPEVLKNFLLRVRDVSVVLDQLERWNDESGHPLAGRLDLKRVGMSGHSFGAITTQAVSGQSYPMVGATYTDPRIRAAVMMSPAAPLNRRQVAAAFGSVKIPWMLLTGTRDNSPVGSGQNESLRLRVYPALPPGGKYELVLYGATHMAFSDRTPALTGGVGAQRNPRCHRAVLALSTAFWDAYLKQDAAARSWLDGNGPAGVLESRDRWQHK